jgi:tryptophanyl-tRNA synthetase
MLDTPEVLRKKINKISTTDLLPENPKDPDTCNVYNIIKIFLNEDEKNNLREKYTAGGMSYKFVKEFNQSLTRSLTNMWMNY